MSKQTIYDIELHGLDGKGLNLKDFAGKHILIVNTASACGYTPQYAQLQELYELHSDKVTVLGCPCNQFGGQEPGTAEQIGSFCEKNYGVTFPLSEKLEVKGDRQHPLYQWLCNKEKNGEMDTEVKWNFHKFLIDEKGKLVGSYPSAVSPIGEELLSVLSLV